MSFSIYVTEKVFTSYEFDTEDAALQAMAQINDLYQGRALRDCGLVPRVEPCETLDCKGQVLGSEVMDIELIEPEPDVS